jgi:hypothetical protein
MDDVTRNRPQLVMDLVAIAVAYDVASRPVKPTPWKDFKAYNERVRGALLWLKLADPYATTIRLKAVDPTRAQTLAILQLWWKIFTNDEVTVQKIIAAATERLPLSAEDAAKNPPPPAQWANPEFRRALMAVAADGPRIDNKQFGKWIEARRGQRWVLDETVKFTVVPVRVLRADGNPKMFDGSGVWKLEAYAPEGVSI